MLFFLSFWACTQSDTTEIQQTPSKVPSQETAQNTPTQKSQNQGQDAEQATPVFSGNANAATSGSPNLLQGISIKLVVTTVLVELVQSVIFMMNYR